MLRRDVFAMGMLMHEPVSEAHVRNRNLDWPKAW